MNFFTNNVTNYINCTINRMGYNKLILLLLGISIIFSSFYFLYPFNLIGLPFFNIIIFSIGFYFLIKASIQCYFFFFIYALLQSYINLKNLVYTLDSNSIIILIFFIIILILLLIHGVCRWQGGNKVLQSFIIPTSLTSKKYIMVILGYLLLAIVFAIIFKSLYAGLVIFAVFSLISAIYLINEKKLQAWVFLFCYFISSILTTNDITNILPTIIYCLLCIIGYKYWLFLRANKIRPST